MTFSVFVDGAEQNIMGFEAISSRGVQHSIGTTDETVVKLSLCLSLIPYLVGETITSMTLTTASLNGSFSITVNHIIFYT